MKDVAACDKLRGGGKQPLIRRSPNGETPVDELNRPTSEFIGRVEGTWGSETSQYPEEKKKMIADFLSLRISNGLGGTKSLHDSLSSGERNGTSRNRR